MPSRHITVKGTVDLVDDETFGSNETASLPVSGDVVIENYSAAQLLSRHDFKVGGEVRAEIDATATWLNFPEGRDVLVTGEARLYEGTSEDTTNRRNTREFQFIIPRNRPVTQNIYVNWDGGDSATFKLTFTNVDFEEVERVESGVNVPRVPQRRMASSSTVSRIPSHVDNFWIGPNGHVWSNYWDTNINRWVQPFHVTNGESVALPGNKVTAVARTATSVDIFWVGTDGSILTSTWDSKLNNARWAAPITIAGPGSAASSTKISAVARKENQLDVFWVGLKDGAIWSNWSAEANNRRWAQPFTISGANEADPYKGDVTGMSRYPDQLDIFWTGKDGSIRSNWWSVNWNEARWNATFTVSGPQSAVAGSPIASLSRIPDRQDVFWVGKDEAIWSAWWGDSGNGVRWNAPFKVPGTSSVNANSGISVLARDTIGVDVFWVNKNKAVCTTSCKGQWKGSASQLSRAGSVRSEDSNLTGVSRCFDNMDLFCAGKNGELLTIPWTSSQNWQPAFAITGPKVVSAPFRIVFPIGPNNTSARYMPSGNFVQPNFASSQVQIDDNLTQKAKAKL